MANSNKKQANKPMDKKLLITLVSVATVLVAGLIVICIFAGLEGAKTTAKTTSTTSTTATTATSATVESKTATTTAKDYIAEIDIKDYGKITMELNGSVAPETVNNFVSLVESGFYDGLTFHRIMEGFMMQGGDPEGNGTGGSEQTITGEFSANGFANDLSHTRGAVSMARSNDYNSASSQFFIVHEDSTFLDGQYAVFGYVTDGMDVVDKVCESAEPTDDNGTIPAEEQPVINTITVKEK